MTAYGLGPLPGTSLPDAADVVHSETGDLPHVPDLPARGLGADGVGRTAALLEAVSVDRGPRSWIMTDRPRQARWLTAEEREWLEGTLEEERRVTAAATPATLKQALALLRATGPFDVGQAAVISDNRVLAIEAAEGTDQMLARLAELRSAGQIHAREGAGVLVKAPKAGQDRRFDLPSIGPRTVEGVARAGLAGIAVLAGSTVVAEPDRIAQAADRADVFVVGVSADETDA